MAIVTALYVNNNYPMNHFQRIETGIMDYRIAVSHAEKFTETRSDIPLLPAKLQKGCAE